MKNESMYFFIKMNLFILKEIGSFKMDSFISI